VKNDMEKMTKTMPPPTISAPAPMVMSDMRFITTLMRLGRSAAGTWTITLPANPSWRPTSSKAAAVASKGLRTTDAGVAISSELLRDQCEVQGGHHEVDEEDQDEGDDDALVDGIAHALGAALAVQALVAGHHGGHEAE